MLPLKKWKLILIFLFIRVDQLLLSLLKIFSYRTDALKFHLASQMCQNLFSVLL